MAKGGEDGCGNVANGGDEGSVQVEVARAGGQSPLFPRIRIAQCLLVDIGILRTVAYFVAHRVQLTPCFGHERGAAPLGALGARLVALDHPGLEEGILPVYRVLA